MERPEYCTDEMLAYLSDTKDENTPGIRLACTFPELGWERNSSDCIDKAKAIIAYWEFLGNVNTYINPS